MAQRIDPSDFPFDVPKFDEHEYVRKELISFKTTSILFGFALTIAIVTYFIWRATQWPFFPHLVFVSAVFGFVVKYVFRALKVDIRHFTRKDWIGTGFLYAFFWLGFTLLVFNPPFTDNAGPVVNIAVSPAVQLEGGTVDFTVLVRDNSGIDEASVAFCLHPIGSTPAPQSYKDLSPDQQSACERPWSKGPDGLWRYQWTDTQGQAGRHVYFVLSDDSTGQNNETRGELLIGRPFEVARPNPNEGQGAFLTFQDRLTVRTQPGVDALAVQYVLNGRAYNMVYDEGDDWWFTDPSYPGWTHGDNDVQLQVLEQPQYLDLTLVPGSLIAPADAFYTIAVDPSLTVNSQNEPTYPERQPANRLATPGLGMGAGLGAIGLAAVVGHRRRE